MAAWRLLTPRDEPPRYLHSKGVARVLDRNANARTATFVRLWRYVMEYHLVARWQRCLELLETHEAVGEVA